MADTEPWLQVYLPAVHQIGGVVTQGCGNLDAWTVRYTVRYSADRNLANLRYYPDAQGDPKVGVAGLQRLTQRRDESRDRGKDMEREVQR